MIGVIAAPNHLVSVGEQWQSTAFGRVIDAIEKRTRVEKIHANRLRLSEDVSIGGAFSLYGYKKDQSYILDIKITF